MARGERMLTELDETLLHQGSVPFEAALVSDHRFFDRYVFTTVRPDGEVGLFTSMAVYKNMNVKDGSVATQVGSARQRNLRLSQPLRPLLDAHRLGPVRTEFAEPFRTVRLLCDHNEQGDSFDLTFRAFLPPHLETHHFGRVDGRVHTDYLRFSQVGWTSGSALIDGNAYEVDRWFCWRDHSWGIRPGVGGFEPFTGTRAGTALPSAIRAGGLGILVIYLGFATETCGGLFQLHEDENGRRLYLDGCIGGPAGGVRPIVAAEHEISFVRGTRLFDKAQLRLTADDGAKWTIEVEAIGRAWVLKGLGYDSGFNDGKGLGVWRGDALTVEADTYDVRDREEVVMPDGQQLRPRHREQPVRVTVNGEVGQGHFPIIVMGPNRRYGLS